MTMITSTRSGPARRRATLAVLALVGTMLAATGASAKITLPETAQRYAMDTDEGRVAVKESYGIELQPLRLSGRDYMLDFRYRVLDPDKARALHRVDLQPFVLDADETYWSGVMSGKVGSLRGSRHVPIKDRIYTTILSNPARHFKRGDVVSVVLGDLVLDNIPVE